MCKSIENVGLIDLCSLGRCSSQHSFFYLLVDGSIRLFVDNKGYGKRCPYEVGAPVSVVSTACPSQHILHSIEDPISVWLKSGIPSLHCDPKTLDFCRRKDKIDKKLRKTRAWRKVSSIIFVAAFAAVLISSVVAAAVAAPPVAAAIAASTAAPLISVGKWSDSLWKNYEDAMTGQKEVIGTMQFGTYVTIKDLENIRVLLLDRLQIEIESLQQKADLAITEEVVKLGIDEIKKKLSALMKNIEDLGTGADLCSRDIRGARTVVLQMMINYPNN
ncbi:UPF0496 protein-like protein [Drosera capensis]